MATTTVTCNDGFELGAYEASPAGAPKGAVVVIQEIFCLLYTSDAADD